MKKGRFVIDKVSEESFYENLLLGLTKLLQKSPFISNISLKRYPGATQSEINSWEVTNNVHLPPDLRNFYTSCNGFLYTYNICYDYSTEDKEVHTGRIEVNPLESLVRIYGYETKHSASINNVDGKFSLKLSIESKVFELVQINENCKVALVYKNAYTGPSIWLYKSPMSFHFLSRNFLHYFRMCMAHLGLPLWQLSVTNEELPLTSKEMCHLVAPGVLMQDRISNENPNSNDFEINTINPEIFNFHSHNDEDRKSLNSPKTKENCKKSEKNKNTRVRVRSMLTLAN